jgi:hypothetical protein
LLLKSRGTGESCALFLIILKEELNYFSFSILHFLDFTTNNYFLFKESATFALSAVGTTKESVATAALSGAATVAVGTVVESVEVASVVEESLHEVIKAAIATIARNFFIWFFLILIVKYFYIPILKKSNPLNLIFFKNKKTTAFYSDGSSAAGAPDYFYGGLSNPKLEQASMSYL